MKYLLLSDVHGNRFGLEEVLKQAAGRYDKILCLGDVVGYGAHPNECCALLREVGAISLSGNHDAAALGLIDITWFNPVAEAAILWTRRTLTGDNAQWLRSLPAQMQFAENHFQCVHGSLREPWEEYITGPETAEPNLLLVEHHVCFFGHTHQAVVYRAPAEKAQWTSPLQMQGAQMPEGGTFELEEDWKYLVNPGSCGQPRDGNPQARYALYDIDSQQVQVFAIDYDWDAARHAIINAGLPRMLGDRLLQGH